MRRVLILTAGFGEGHNSAARALQAAFNEQPGIEAELVDIFALRAPRLNNLSRRGYLKLINTAPRVWSRFYRWLDRSPRAPAMLRTLASHRRLLGRLITEQQPLAIVSTYPVYPWLLNRLRRQGQVFCPHFTVITDALTINSLWYRTPSEGWFVTDHDSAAYLRARGVAPGRIQVSGFPVNLKFADRPAQWQPPAIRECLKNGLSSRGPQRAVAIQSLDSTRDAEPVEVLDCFGGTPSAPSRNDDGRWRILFMINSGRGPALRIARELLQHRNWRITFTAGRDAKLRRELEALAAGAPALADILGWTDRIPELLMTHHVAISKAGGATTQEAINALCPLIVSQIIPGQEEGNYELLHRHNAGALAETPAEIVTTLQRAFANDAALWQLWRKNLRNLAHPAAARQIAARILAQVSPNPVRTAR